MRCFVAIELTSEVRSRLAELPAGLHQLSQAVRWTRPEQIHLTVKFLGEVPDADAARVCELARTIAARYQPFELNIAGAGLFPPRGLARIVWVGVADPPESLLHCVNDCEAEYGALGFPRENRPYSPHLTVGRVKDMGASPRIREAVRQIEEFSAGRCTATELVVFQSELRPSGPIYTPLAHAPFGG